MIRLPGFPTTHKDLSTSVFLDDLNFNWRNNFLQLLVGICAKKPFSRIPICLKTEQ